MTERPQSDPPTDTDTQRLPVERSEWTLSSEFAEGSRSYNGGCDYQQGSDLQNVGISERRIDGTVANGTGHEARFNPPVLGPSP